MIKISGPTGVPMAPPGVPAAPPEEAAEVIDACKGFWIVRDPITPTKIVPPKAAPPPPPVSGAPPPLPALKPPWPEEALRYPPAAARSKTSIADIGDIWGI